MKSTMILIGLTFLLFSTLTNAQTQLGQTLIEEASGDEFGESVAMNVDGSILAVGAILNDGNGNNSGSVQVFSFNESTSEWEQLGQDIDGQGPNNFSGTSVRLNAQGNIVAIGANGPAGNTGQVRVYEFDEGANQWVQLGQNIDGINVGDNFGFSIDLNTTGETVLVSAFFADAGGLSDAGEISVFSFDGTNWVQQGQTIGGGGAGQNFGISTAINGDGSIIAASEPNSNVGITRVFSFNDASEQWEQLGQSIVGQGTFGAGFRIDLNENGNRLAVGDPFTGGSGLVSIFEFNENNNQWALLGESIPGENDGDTFGTRLELDSTGDILISGTSANDDGGTNAGQVRIFMFNNNTSQWEQVGDDINGDFDNELSNEVAISDDGFRIAIGSPFAAEGRVRVFELSDLLSVEENLIDISLIQVYPNPAVNNFVINNLQIPIENINITDIQGRIVRVYNDIDTSYDISGLNSGLYFVTISIGENRITRKLIKN